MRALKQKLAAFVAFVLIGLLPNLASAQYERSADFTRVYETGVAALEAEDWEAAVEAFDQTIALDDTFAEAHFGRAEALRELEDYGNATNSYQKALQLNQEYAQAYNGRGVCHRELNNMELALNDFRNAAEKDRRDASIAANLGDILVNVFQRPVEAMQYLDRAIERDPEDAEAFRNRGWAHTLLREFEDGILDLNKAIELDPSDYETYQRLASVHLAEEEFQLGVDALSKAIENYEPEQSSDPDTYIMGYLMRADARTKLAKESEDLTPDQLNEIYAAVVADADSVLEEFPDRFPESGRAMYRKGLALRMQGLFAEAITSFTDAIQLIPPGNDSEYYGEAYLRRGICWFYQGQNDLARGDFREAASKNFDDPLPHLWIGFTQANETDYRKAIESYGESAARNPAFALAHVNRGLAYMQLEDYGKAVSNFNEAIRAEPTEPKHFYKRGIAHELLGEPEKALNSFNLALHRDSDFTDAHQGAARALRALGRPNLGDIEENKAGANR